MDAQVVVCLYFAYVCFCFVWFVVGLFGLCFERDLWLIDLF